MNLEQAKIILKALMDSKPNPEDYDFGPAYEFAKIGHRNAIKIIKNTIKDLQKG